MRKESQEGDYFSKMPFTFITKLYTMPIMRRLIKIVLLECGENLSLGKKFQSSRIFETRRLKMYIFIYKRIFY